MDPQHLWGQEILKTKTGEKTDSVPVLILKYIDKNA